MTIDDIEKSPRIFGSEYDNHKLFEDLDTIKSFYEGLSYCNITSIEPAALVSKSKVYTTSTYIYSSMAGTMESIAVLMHNGRCNDAFALVRKYCDSIILDIYKNILVNDFNNELCSKNVTSIIEKNKLKRWIDAEDRLFEEKEIIQVYKTITNNFPELSQKFHLSEKNTLYHKLRDICNDNMHYNYLYTMAANNWEIVRAHDKLRKDLITTIHFAIRLFFTIHFSYTYVGNPSILGSTDFTDYLDCGEQPPEGCERWVPTIVQTAFTLIKEYRPQIANYLLSLDLMDLE